MKLSPTQQTVIDILDAGGHILFAPGHSHTVCFKGVYSEVWHPSTVALITKGKTALNMRLQTFEALAYKGLIVRTGKDEQGREKWEAQKHG